MKDLQNPLDEDEGWKLLEQQSINDRTVMVWYNPNDEIISLMIFNLTEQPNKLSQNSPYTTWGYITHSETNISSCEEASEVVSLYLQDIENENYWWEEDHD